MHFAQNVLEVHNSRPEPRKSVAVYCKLAQEASDFAIKAEAETAIAELARVAASRLKIVPDIAKLKVRILILASTAAADSSAEQIAQALHQP